MQPVPTLVATLTFLEDRLLNAPELLLVLCSGKRFVCLESSASSRLSGVVCLESSGRGGVSPLSVPVPLDDDGKDSSISHHLSLLGTAVYSNSFQSSHQERNCDRCFLCVRLLFKPLRCHVWLLEFCGRFLCFPCNVIFTCISRLSSCH